MSKLNNIVMFACSEGGHFSQMMALSELFGKYDSILVTDNVRATKRMPALSEIGDIIVATGMAKKRKEVTGKESSNRWFYLSGYLSLFNECRKIYSRYRPKVIVSTGSNIAVPLFLLGWIYGSKLIFVETRAKVYAKSLTGILIGRFADHIFVQWPEMLKLYPKAKYCGTLV